MNQKELKYSSYTVYLKYHISRVCTWFVHCETLQVDLFLQGELFSHGFVKSICITKSPSVHLRHRNQSTWCLLRIRAHGNAVFVRSFKAKSTANIPSSAIWLVFDKYSVGWKRRALEQFCTQQFKLLTAAIHLYSILQQLELWAHWSSSFILNTRLSYFFSASVHRSLKAEQPPILLWNKADDPLSTNPKSNLRHLNLST